MDTPNRVRDVALVTLRITFGVVFLWAGLEKVLGSGPEGFSAAGFLQFATAGSGGWPFVTGEVAEGTVFNPTQGFWVGLASNDAAMTIINFIVPWGQIGIGLSLILGLFTRFGAAMGALMMLGFFLAAWDFEFGIVNEHLVYAIATGSLGVLAAGEVFGLDGLIERLQFVRRRPAIQYLLG